MLKVSVAIVLSLMVVAACFTWVAMQWTYSDGQRAGYLQKLTRKGWLCKIWEGEMTLVTVPGTATDKFQFTIRDDRVAAELIASAGQRMALHYQQHKLIPSSCFGETEYFVTGARRITD